MTRSPVAHVNHFLWGNADLRGLPWWRAAFITLMRYFYATARDLAQGDLQLRATSLAYTTLLSMVPLLAVSFSMLKAFGVYNKLEPMLLEALAPLGPSGEDITHSIISFVNNMKVGALGTAGLVTLFYTVVSVMQKIERAFNHSWRVTAERTPKQRFSDYLTVIIIGPVLVFTAFGITASLMNNQVAAYLSSFELLGRILRWIARLLPYLIVIGAFTFVYVFMPNTRVRTQSAFTGAVTAGILWQAAGWAFAKFVAGSAHYTAIYATFASLFLFIIWLYVAWLILLTGANIAFYHQHPEYLHGPRRDPVLSLREQEALALLAVAHITAAMYRNEPPCTLATLVRRLRMPQGLLRKVLDPLQQAGLLRMAAGREPAYLLARAPEATTVDAVLDVVRSADAAGGLETRAGAAFLARWRDYEQAITTTAKALTLKDLAGMI